MGARRDGLPAHWSELLGRALVEPNDHLYKQPVELRGNTRYLTFHRAELQADDDVRGGTVILVEDHSEMKWLEDELVHAARLAGVPCVAQQIDHHLLQPLGVAEHLQLGRTEIAVPDILARACQPDQVQRLFGDGGNGDRRQGGVLHVTTAMGEAHQ